MISTYDKEAGWKDVGREEAGREGAGRKDVGREEAGRAGGKKQQLEPEAAPGNGNMAGGKKQLVETMFDSIAPTYDALNHILSLGIDRGWRRRVVKMAAEVLRGLDYGATTASDATAPRILDVATGTGDLAIAMARKIPAARVVGIDISEGMLAAGGRKVARRGLSDRISLCAGDAEALDFADGRGADGAAADGATGGTGVATGGATGGTSGGTAMANGEVSGGASGGTAMVNCEVNSEVNSIVSGGFDLVTVAFGVRNFGDIEAGLREMRRVLRPGGRCMILEFSEPRGRFFGTVYRWYFHRVLPLVGRVVSRNRGAYTYLPRSVDGFPPPTQFSAMLLSAGFSAVRARRLTFGVAYIYEAER
ncbi:MAG: class I SAM-dependent methyltransferase [Alistipes sp.]|jgi:demethylmenaquinone methyltransferase/2-methoxy-6-polyprenyl-1,4-benzoquinol methylase|nr:class I SAM-dependent methyltransferase [Alistipes sp.]